MSSCFVKGCLRSGKVEIVPPGSITSPIIFCDGHLDAARELANDTLEVIASEVKKLIDDFRKLEVLASSDGDTKDSYSIAT